MSQNTEYTVPNPFEQNVPLDSADLPDVDLNQLMKGHVWVQEGINLECRSCVYPHGMMLHGHEKLTHQEGALPIVKNHTL